MIQRSNARQACAYCARPATTRIVANPGQVCAEHAAEFWSGVLRYNRGTLAPGATRDLAGTNREERPSAASC